MPVDPTVPETFEEIEEKAAGDRDAARDEEVSEADAAEQHTDVRQEQDDPLTSIDPNSANEADAAEQARVVTMDEDDYR